MSPALSSGQHAVTADEHAPAEAGVPEAVDDDPSGVMALFSNRVEHKYFLRPRAARAFVDELQRHVPLHHFEGPGANKLPHPTHYISTLYLDTPERDIAKACTRSSESIKLRVREYYDEHPDLAELATSRAAMFRHSSQVWLEIKTHEHAKTRKVRLSIASAALGEFLRHALAGEAPGPDLDANTVELLDQLGDLRRRFTGRLQPDCIANYRRRAWQDKAGEIRVTLDTRLDYHRPPLDMFERGLTLHEVSEQAAVASLGTYLVEIKLVREAPEWLSRLIQSAGLEPARLASGRRFSKFLAASGAVHGKP